MRVIAVDYGSARTGIALGDTHTRLAMPFTMFDHLAPHQLVAAIGKLVTEEGAQTVVVGLPLNMDGTMSAQAKKTEDFITGLAAVVTVPIERMDERLTSYHAEGQLAGNFTRQQKRQRVDALAAARILQDYFDQLPPREPPLA